MRRLMLSVRSYSKFMSSEDWQFAEGLRLAGWFTAYADEGSVPELLDHYQPDTVLLADPRDFRLDSAGCFDRSAEFRDYDALRDCGATVLTVLKDAGSVPRLQLEVIERVQPHAFVTWYHEQSIRPLCKWLAPDFQLIRTYHTVDADDVRAIRPEVGERQRGCVTGARRALYPVRELAYENAAALGLNVMRHPGYRATGSHTSAYLRYLAGFKVSVATASVFGFALRKIIESVAVGCAVVSTLPVHDMPLPAIDDTPWMRLPNDCGVDTLRSAVDMAECGWTPQEAAVNSSRVIACYDYRYMGQKLTHDIDSFAAQRAAA